MQHTKSKNTLECGDNCATRVCIGANVRRFEPSQLSNLKNLLSCGSGSFAAFATILDTSPDPFIGTRIRLPKSAEALLLEYSNLELMFAKGIISESLSLSGFEIFSEMAATIKALDFSQEVRDFVEDHLLKNLMRVSVLFYQLYQSRSKLDKTAALAAFALSLPEEMTALAWDSMRSYLLNFSSGISSESASEKVQSFLSASTRIINSPHLSIFRKLALNLVALKLAPKQHCARIVSLIGKPSKAAGSYLDLLENVFSSLSNIMKISDAVVQGVPWTEALLADNPTASLINEVTIHLQFENFTYRGLPQENETRMSRDHFLAKLNMQIKNLAFFKKRTLGLSKEHLEISTLLMKCERIAFVMTNAIRSEHRSAPLAFVISGPPGIGKSELLKALCRWFSEVYGIPNSPEIIYHRQIVSDYWENYDPTGQPIIHYSEVGTATETYAAAHGDKAITELTSIIDDINFPVNMAFEDKGKVFACPKLIIMDTNSTHLNIPQIVSNPAAFRRRYLLIEPSVLPEFLMEGSPCSIDSLKSIAKGGDLLDRWSFRVSGSITQDKVSYKDDFMMKSGDIYELEKFVKGKITSHAKNAELKRNAFTVNKNEKIFFGPKTKIESESGRMRRQVQQSLIVLIFQFISLAFTAMFVHNDRFFSDTGFAILDRLGIFGSAMLHSAEWLAFGFRNILWDSMHNYFPFAMPRRTMTFYEVWKYNSDSYYRMHWDAMPDNVAEMNYLRDATMSAINGGRIIVTEPCDCHWLKRFTPELMKAVFFDCVSYATLYFKYVMVWTWSSLFLIFTKRTFKSDAFIILYVYGAYCFNSFFYRLYWIFYFLWLNLAFTFVITAFVAAQLSKHFSWITYAYFSIIVGRQKSVSDKKYVQICERLSSERPQILPESNKNLFLAIALLCAGSLAIIRVYKTTLHSESSSFNISDPMNEIINKKEDKYECDAPYARVKVKDTNVWNTLELPLSHIKTRNTLARISVQVMRNVRQCKMVFNDKNFSSCLLGIKGNIAMINKHFFMGRTDPFVIHVAPVGKTVYETTTWVETQINPKAFVEIAPDIVLIEMSSWQFRDIVDLFPVDRFREKFSHESLIEFNKTIAKYHGPDDISDATGPIRHDHLVSYPYANHRKGLCGTPLISKYAGGTHIISIHSGGADGFGYGTALCKSEVVKGYENIISESPFHTIYSEAHSHTTSFPLPKSPVNYEDLGPLRYLGKLPGPVMMKNKSKVKLTPHSAIMEDILNLRLEIDGVPKFGAPMMRPMTIDGEYVSPMNKALRKFAVNKKALDRETLVKCKDELVARILSQIGDRKLTPLNVEDAINGHNEDVYLRSMKSSTASGFGFDGPKSSHIPISMEYAESQYREPTPELKNRLNDILEAYERGETVSIIYEGCLKDEVRAHEKCLNGGTRVFYISPVDFVIISRMFLAPFYTMMAELNEVFGTSVGINMYSGADEFARRKKLFKNFIAGDIKSFDINSPSDIRRTFNTVVYEVLEALGYTSYALKIVAGILTENLFIYFCLNMDLFVAAGSQPSGKYATAEDNSGANIIMQMYIWYMLYPLRKFFDHVQPDTYGDDLASGVNEDSPKYNNHYFVFAFEKYLGMGFTAPDKSAISKNYYNFNEIEYLKRTFKFSKFLNRYIAPLDQNSLLKMVCYYIPSNSISEIKQWLQALTSCSYEMVLHSNEDQFFAFRERCVNELAPHIGCTKEDLLLAIPEYPELVQNMFGEKI